MNNFLKGRVGVLFSIILITFVGQVSAETLTGNSIELNRLGKFNIEFSPLQAAQIIEGTSVVGRVEHKLGASYQVTLPFDVQQRLFAVNNGQHVKKGEVIVTIDGIDVHHYVDEFEAAKTIYLNNKKHFQAIKNSADNRTLKSTEWLAINKSFVEAKLNYEHFAHLEKIIRVDQNDIISIVSPSDGLVNLNNLSNNILFEVIPKNSLLVKTYLPFYNVTHLNTLKTTSENCVLSTESVEPIIDNYQQVVWSKVSESCDVKLGQQLSVTPHYAVEGFQVNKASIFELDNQDYVAVKKGAKLSLAAVSIIGKRDSYFVIQSNMLAYGDEILSSSVSIAQGVFMGLGE
jgi:hypothetical protein